MTASERLRELDDLTTYPDGVIARSEAAAVRGRRLLDLLPLIADVVEAAEDFARVSVPRHLVEYEDEYVAKMADALTALRDALGDGNAES